MTLSLATALPAQERADDDSATSRRDIDVLRRTHDRVRETSGGRQQPTLPSIESGENFPLFRVEGR